MSPRVRIVTIAVAVVLLALALRFHGIGWGLPQVYEEAYPFKKSWDMWGWGAQRPLDFNPHFFNYPTLYFYVQFLGQGLLFLVLRLAGGIESVLDYRVLYALDKTDFYLLGRSITALTGVMTVVCLLQLGRRIGGLAVGVAAAGLLAVNQMHIAKSQVIEVDVPLTLFVVLTCAYALRLLERPVLRHYLLAGLFGGLATSTKYSGMFLALPIVLAHLIVWVRSERAHTVLRSELSRRRTAANHGATHPSSLALWRGLGLASLAFAGAALATSPYILLDRAAFWQGFNYERLHMQLGHFGLDNTPAIHYYLRVMTGNLLGWPLSLLALVGLVHFLFVRPRAWAWVLAAFPLVYLAVIASFSMKADRYILPLLPIAALFATSFVAHFASHAARLHRLAPVAVTALLALVMALPSFAAYERDRARLRGDTRTLAYEWIENNVAPGSFIVSESYGPEVMGALDLHALDFEVRQVILEKHPEAKVYALQVLPMYQVLSEYSSAFYDLTLYDPTADYVVTSSSVGSRYRKDPKLFARQVAFYDELERRYTKVQEFGSPEVHGPRLTIYKNPAQSTPFAQRDSALVGVLPGDTSSPLQGAIANFYERFAFNHEAYGFDAAAAFIYQRGLWMRSEPLAARNGLALGAIRCLARMGRSTDALQLLLALEAQAPNASERAHWTRLRERLTAPAESPATP